MPPVKATTPVHEIMSVAPVTVRESTTADELLELFDRHDYNALPVTDDAGRLVGIVTKLDLLRALRPRLDLALPDLATIGATSVAHIMRPGVITIEGEDPIGAAADLMLETELRSVPVVRRGSGAPELVGMVSRGDVIRGLRFALQSST